MKIAIITSGKVGSPKVLSSCLHASLKEQGIQADLFNRIDVFKRLVDPSQLGQKYHPALWSIYRLCFLLPDRLFIRKLNSYDAIIIVETSPYGFLRHSYNFAKLRQKLRNTPLLYYGVYYLGNAPTMVKYLKENNHYSIDLFDWHLAVCEVTEIRQKPQAPWSQIGLHLKSTDLRPDPKEGLLGLVDFARPGFEEMRDAQIQVLKKLKIPYVALEGKYSIEEIREIYRKATFYFMQSGESFGVPLAECLSCGCYIFTPDSSWPMAWRLDQQPQIHGPGTLADCFVLYRNKTDLEEKLRRLAETYDLENTPKQVFDFFSSQYPYYYESNKKAMQEVLDKIRNREIGHRNN